MSIKNNPGLLVAAGLIFGVLCLNGCSSGTASQLLTTPTASPNAIMESAPSDASIASTANNTWISQCVSTGVCSVTIPGTGQVAIEIPGVATVNASYTQGSNLIATTGTANSTLWSTIPIISGLSITANWESADFSAIESTLTSSSTFIVVGNNAFVGGLTSGNLLGTTTILNNPTPAIIVPGESTCSSTDTSSAITTLNITTGANTGSYIILGTSSGKICSYAITGANAGNWTLLSSIAGYTSTAQVNAIGLYANSTTRQLAWITADGNVWSGVTSLDGATPSISLLSALSNFPTGASITALAISATGNVYIGTSAGNVYALYSGQTTWSYPLNISTTPIQNLSTPLPGTDGAATYDVYAFAAGSTTAYGIIPQQ